MDLSTTYLGLPLAHPLMVGASPLVDDLDVVRRLEDAGASAIVMRSLFEEQVRGEQLAALRHLDGPGESFAEALSYFPAAASFGMSTDAYLDRLRRIREAVRIPVIGSLNGSTPGGWLEYARFIEQAGAHALELNLYTIPTDPLEDAAAVEARAVDVVREVKKAIRIPVAVKLSPFYSSLASFVRRLEEAGADGVVLFNRFYQPDIDPDTLDVVRDLHLSDSSELPLRLRFLAILFGHVGLSLAATGGVHSSRDALKAIMAGASGVQMVSALLKRGPAHLGTVVAEVSRWLEENEYASLHQAIGSMSLLRCPDPTAYERANYVQILQSWHGN